MSGITLGGGRPRRRKSLLRNYAEVVICALLLALGIRTFVVQAFQIPSESMVPTLLVGDHLLGNKFVYGVKIPFTNTYLYRGRDPQRGDVIIFAYPRDPSLDYIKRVIGVPGDRIKVVNKQLYVNGEPLKEDYIQILEPDRIEGIRDNFAEIVVPEGKYFMMGDNRDNSQDSRFWGLVDRTAMRARAWRIYVSLDWNGVGKGGFVRWDRMGMEIR